MANPTAEFFAELGRRGYERLIADTTGSIRVDVVSEGRTDSWFVTIRLGEIHISQEEREADCLLRAERALFDRIVTGETKLFSARIRSEVRIEGDAYLARVFERLLPGSPHAHHPRAFARERGQRA